MGKTAGNYDADGNLIAGGDVTAGDDITAGDDLVVTDDASIGGDLAVTGSAAITGNATADDVTAAGHVAAAGLRVGTVAVDSEDYGYIYADGTNSPIVNRMIEYDYGAGVRKIRYLWNGVYKFKNA